MQPISSILFPVDFSPRCSAVVPLIKATAKKLDSKVTLFYAIQLPQGLFALEHAHPFTIDVEAMLSNGREELLRFYVEAAGASEETVETAAEIGDPALSIVEYAGDNHIDLIMMPTHGYGRFRGMLLGSVTAKVLHDAACPVWTATHTEDTESPAHAGCKSVLCALDLKSGSADLLRHAADFAARFDARVRIVHAVSEALPGAGAMAGTNFLGFLTDAAREEIDSIQASVGTRFDVCLSARPVADWVRETAYHHAADLVVIGRGRLQGALGRLRTNAYSIIREAPCPVLSF
jgi:nucleotide-binding universal stress UspA family protein